MIGNHEDTLSRETSNKEDHSIPMDKLKGNS